MQSFEPLAVVVPRVSPVSWPEQDARLFPAPRARVCKGGRAAALVLAHGLGSRGLVQTSQATGLRARSVALQGFLRISLYKINY